MFLSQLVVNQQHPQVDPDRGDAHQFHQRLLQGFADSFTAVPKADWHILFRQEPHSTVVWVQSAIEPDWSQLPAGYLIRSDTQPTGWVAKELANQVFEFRLRANPSKRDRITRKLMGLSDEADQLTWLRRQGDRGGFAVQTATVKSSPPIVGRKGEGGTPIRITPVLYDGMLTVTDGERFLTKLQEGVGRGKSYGCGLLSISQKPA
ncbi:MAG: type I-E CRISPR-associated protein Cas6/Cse3/CasE [Cyanobacteria bacterium]|nr:type I-E CRISPR-associated protein Cas6/Cse3/CasE [Cyanobacteriota bacterium]MDA0865567.1 type I-E CRISPR-associated protein Cas6/Cse3/CasE [Cyanobacteriota bacterium]